MDFPVDMVKGKDIGKCIHPVDLKGWIDAGWSPKDKKGENKKTETKAHKTPKELLIEEATRLGVELDGNETSAVLTELIKEAKTEAGE
jgi:hypothetical protein